MKKKKVIKIISNVALIIGILLFGYYIFDFISSRAGLPVDVCPFDNSRPFAIAATCFLVVSLVLSFFEEKKKKVEGEEKKEEEKKKKEK